MAYRKAVHEFIEACIDQIDDGLLNEVFLAAYSDLDNTECSELIDALSRAGLDAIQARDSALLYVLTRAVEGFLDSDHDKLRVGVFQASYLTSRLGYSWSELIDFIQDNASEWPEVEWRYIGPDFWIIRK